MSMNRGSSMQNGLIDPVTLTFDLLTPKAYHFEYIPIKSLPMPSLNTLGSFVFELCCGQTDRQTDGTKRANTVNTRHCCLLSTDLTHGIYSGGGEVNEMCRSPDGVERVPCISQSL